MTFKAVVPMREVAVAMGVTQRCAKRRLKKLDTKLGGGLLVQFAPGGHFFADLAGLKRHLPGVLIGDAEDPAVAAMRHILEVRDMAREILERLSA